MNRSKMVLLASVYALSLFVFFEDRSLLYHFHKIPAAALALGFMVLIVWGRRVLKIHPALLVVPTFLAIAFAMTVAGQYYYFGTYSGYLIW